MSLDLSDKILFEDADLLVLNKPPHISVTPGPGNPFEKTIAGWLLKYIGESLYKVGTEDRWGIVHRLDKDTSGVLLTAKTSNQFEHLASQFKEREIEKEYEALTWGSMLTTLQKKNNAVNTNSFVIDAPIARHPSGFSKFIVDAEGKQSRTLFEIGEEYQVEDRDGAIAVTSVLARPETGRTHQIRVHLKAFGHVIVGDKTYQTRTQHAISQRIVDRQFLHAKSITFMDSKGESCTFVAPLSKDLEDAMGRLQK